MKIAVVRIRGIRNISPKIKNTLKLMNLEKPNNCVVVEDSAQNMGMVQVCKDYITYGAVSEKTLFELLRKRGEKGGRQLREVMEEDEIAQVAKKIMHEENVKNFVNPVFRLHPPRKGYKTIKKPAPEGDLGKREDMDSLLKRMM
ncbi:50S ribosomal protein L30 [Candidatus Micrarchaeota archaeon]|nr:50S ribosomal protein L30 [Candidatus Micrarchaeota archaeon]